MAYDLQNYRPGNQNCVASLSSTHSTLDGVPFKVSSTFIPPTQPILPPDLLGPDFHCQALNQEYEYDTEEAVLAWAKAREEAKANAIAKREAAELAKAEERARAAVKAAESHSSSDSDEDLPDASQPSASAEDVAETPQPLPPVKPPWQLPLACAGSSAILTPTPIQSSSKKVQSPMAAKTPVDLALFEQEGDPFDNMELQTINDMEELRTLLGGTNVDGSSQDPSPTPENQSVRDVGKTENGHSNDLGQISGISSHTVFPMNNLYENVNTRPLGMTPCDIQSNRSNSPNVNNMPTNSDLNAGFGAEGGSDMDYVQIRSDYSQQSVSFQQQSVPIYNNIGSGTDSSLGGRLPEKYTDSKVFKPVLPPICPRGKSLGSEPMLDTASGNVFSSGFSSTDPSCLSQTTSRVSFPSGGMSQNQSPYFPSSSSGIDNSTADQLHMYSNFPTPNLATTGPTHNCTAARFAHNSMTAAGTATSVAGINPYSHYTNSRCDSPRTVEGVDASRAVLRSASSNPDLTVGRPFSGSTHSGSQPWNPYKPLPPTPVSELRSSSSSTESLPTDHSQTISPRAFLTATSQTTTSVPAQLEHDPYNSLSSDAKTLVNNLTFMGFPRPRASRAVHKFGNDEREVLDHLFNVDKLVEKKFTPALAETGLQLFKNDVQKAENYLHLYQQFTELGFASDRIQTALVKHELDRDKALDYLTT